jgi:magnesium-transporting ATPase (P-type)
MITGDNVLTALHVAHELKFIRKNRMALILDNLGFLITLKLLIKIFFTL